ncbi:HNH endonuclease [Methylorubrum zatmanii]|uniref:HNH endonuclease n=1 Tax=Methylorubrum zatmanii TaxID=29429 RepID=A0ABW1WP66_9HYPH|nr:HNH endonuclease signature motif containing protein [Methylorubrum zatmanii]MBD8906852.1 HNH endonuclease [Methylorubrum zatmanii]
MSRLYRAEEADVGTTARKALTPTQRLKMFEAHKGMCVLCGRKIQAGEPWIDEHRVPLSMGGSNDLSNRGPAHKPCADAKTHGKDGDLANAAKVKRQKMRHLGISQPKGRPLTSAGFQKAPPQRRASAPLNKTLPPRRSLFGEA